ncbi:lymphocyte antigen 6L-like [Acomys russatus]|uniref:lymphocyte antigen 6L-like n=1 Tax=Acomys russatus TaxID=60746 RepID=UPI0021E25BDB|nr:lymphocyte antigen 6L-like [Acomys russatus]
MTQLLLVLWASLVSVELAPGLPTTAVPGKAQNLSCFQCFKVRQFNECKPMKCQPNENVCLSNEVLLYSSTKSRAQISKRCSVRCLNSNSFVEWPVSNGFQAKITRQCCARNLCNRAPATWERFGALPGRLLMPMGLNLLCTLLSTLVP